MNTSEINEVAAKKVVAHFNQQGIAILAVVGLNVNCDQPGAFTIMASTMNAPKVKQLLIDLLEEFDHHDAKTWVSSI